MADKQGSTRRKQPKDTKSFTSVPSKRHKHEWVLIEKWDSKAKSLSLRAHIIDMINEDSLPRYTSETWACHCGERKVNSHKHASLIDLLATDAPSQVSSHSDAPSQEGIGKKQ